MDGGINLPDFRLYYKATVIKTVQCKDRNIDQWKKNSSKMNPCTDRHLIFDKCGKNIKWRKDNVLWCWENCSTACKGMKVEHFLTP